MPSDWDNYNPISNYDVLLGKKTFCSATGIFSHSLNKYNSGNNPIIQFRELNNGKSKIKRKKLYTTEDLIKLQNHLGTRPQLPKKPIVIAVWNNKGGVGKSMISQHIGSIYASLCGLKTLLIDTDGQADLTLLMDLDQKIKEEDIDKNIDLQPTLRDVIGWNKRVAPNEYELVQVNYKEAIIPLSPTLSLLPSDTDVSDLDTDLFVLEEDERYFDPETGNNLTRIMQVKKFIDSLDSEFDIVIIDCAPNPGVLNMNVLAASDILVIPVEIEPKCIHSISRVSQRLGTYAELFEGIVPDKIIAVPNKFQNQTLKEKALGILRSRYPEIMSNVTLRLYSCIDRCSASKQPLFKEAEMSRNVIAKRMANDFWSLAHEILDLKETMPLFDVEA